MEDGRSCDRDLQNVYDTVPALPSTTPALSTSARSGRRTGIATTNRTVKEGVFDGGPRPPCARFHRGVSSTSSRSSGTGERPWMLRRLPTATDVHK